MRKSDLFFLYVGICLFLIGLAFVHGSFRIQSDGPALARKAQMVAQHGLTDLCLFTEARYTRHPSQADWHAAFQDHPVSLEHFPSGSVIGPPEALRGKSHD